SCDGCGSGLGNLALARYNGDGSLDSSFGSGGRITTSFGNNYQQASGAAIQTDGKIVAVGFTHGTTVDFALARYSASTTPPPTPTPTPTPTPVSYNICPLFDQNKAYKSGSTLPVKLELCDSSGNNVSSPSIVVNATSLVLTSTSAPAPLADSGNANPDYNFRFDPDMGRGGGYIFNLSLKGVSTGTYALRFTAGGDPTTHSLTFQVK